MKMEFVNNTEKRFGHINCVDEIHCKRVEHKRTLIQRLLGKEREWHYEVTATIGISDRKMSLVPGDQLLMMDMCLNIQVVKVIDSGWRKYGVISIDETGYDIKAHDLLGQEFEVMKAPEKPLVAGPRYKSISGYGRRDKVFNIQPKNDASK
jgi:hypothetical protein